MSKQKAYWTHEIASYLEVSDSTVRKWCIELEKQGYTFVKSENGSRAFVANDRELLINLKQIMRTSKLTTKDAVKQVLDEANALAVNDQRMGAEILERGAFEREFEKLNKRLDQQEEFNQKILERMEERDKNLMMVLNELYEQKKQLPSANPKNKKWWNFWKRSNE